MAMLRHQNMKRAYIKISIKEMYGLFTRVEGKVVLNLLPKMAVSFRQERLVFFASSRAKTWLEKRTIGRCEIYKENI